MNIIQKMSLIILTVFGMSTQVNAAAAIDVATGVTDTVSGVISGTGPLQKTSAGKLILSGTNTYTGNTEINAGELSIAAANNIGSAGSVSFTGASTLDTTGSLTLALATKTAAATFVPSAGTTLTITSLLGAADMTVTGASSTAIVSLSALLPVGTGNYTVVEGVLRLARATTTGSGALDIQSGGILDCATNLVLLAGDLPSGTLTLRAGGILQVGAGTFTKAIVLG
jgi:fibronectin-binding autotransporter adhesin